MRLQINKIQPTRRKLDYHNVVIGTTDMILRLLSRRVLPQ